MFWNKTVRKIVDISVLCIGAALLLGIGGGTVLNSYNDQLAYEAEYDAKIDTYRDETGHIPVEIPRKDPTETEDGNTDGKQCLLCGEYYGGYHVLPKLSPEYYDREATTGDTTVTKTEVFVTWTLKQSYCEQEGITPISFMTSYKQGFINVNGKTYLPYEFSQNHPGIDMSFDASTNTIVWDVVKEGGAVIKDEYIKCALSGTNLLIKGQPLTITSEAEQDGLTLTSAELIIENETTICVNDNRNSLTGKSGISVNKFHVKEGGRFHIRNFQYGVYLPADSTSIVEGELDVSGASGAHGINSGYGSRKINLGEEHAVFINEVRKQVGGTYAFTTTSTMKHLVVCNNSTDVKDALHYVISDLDRPTTSSGGHVKYTCAGCGTTSLEFDLPALNTTDYTFSSMTISLDDAPYEIPCYTLNSYPRPLCEKLAIDTLSEFNCFIANGKYYSKDYWNAKFPKAQATESGEIGHKTLSITLSGDQTVTTIGEGENVFDGTLEFLGFEKIVIKGSGTLTVDFANACDAINTANIEIQSGAELKIVGKGNTANSGIKVTDYAQIDGKLTVSNFLNGVYVSNSKGLKETFTIGSTGEVSVTNSQYGVFNDVQLDFVSEGTFKFDNSSMTKRDTFGGALSSLALTTYVFEGNSVTDIKSAKYGITGAFDGINGSAASVVLDDPKVRISDNSKFTVVSYDTCVNLLMEFIIENENGSKSNAEVSLTTSNASNGILRTPWSSVEGNEYTHKIVFNSSKEVYLTKTGNKGGSAINLRPRWIVLKFHSYVTVKNYNNAIGSSSIKFHDGDVVYDNTDPKLKLDNTTSLTNGDSGGGAAYNLSTIITASR